MAANTGGRITSHTSQTLTEIFVLPCFWLIRWCIPVDQYHKVFCCVNLYVLISLSCLKKTKNNSKPAGGNLKPPSWSKFLILDDGNRSPVGSFSSQLASCMVRSVGFLSVSPFHSLPFHRHSGAMYIFPHPPPPSQITKKAAIKQTFQRHSPETGTVRFKWVRTRIKWDWAGGGQAGLEVKLSKSDSRKFQKFLEGKWL